MKYFTFTKASLTLLLIINLILISTAQEPPTPKTLTELKKQLNNEMKKQHVAGLMLAMVTKDSILYSGGMALQTWKKNSCK